MAVKQAKQIYKTNTGTEKTGAKSSQKNWPEMNLRVY